MSGGNKTEWKSSTAAAAAAAAAIEIHITSVFVVSVVLGGSLIHKGPQNVAG